ncbi:hypothetical protein DPMN_087930 [Dreissena polymorpha]|uniref:Uncharacterized protein n=1 Tax=Dreissena polymorpha TaxID=45954 RepID=A0A9D4KT83_DREPO|nr:hypothetical protein DPMN_087930 [Dreissena polymorpha]
MNVNYVYANSPHSTTEIWSYRAGYGPIALEWSSYRSGAVGCQYSTAWSFRSKAVGCQYSSMYSSVFVNTARSSVSIARSAVNIARSSVSIALYYYRSGAVACQCSSVGCQYSSIVLSVWSGRLSSGAYGLIGWSYRSGAGPIGLERSVVTLEYGHCGHIGLERSVVMWSCRSGAYGPVVWSNRSGAYGLIGLERSSVTIARSVVMWSCRSGAYGPVVWANRSGAVVCQYNSMYGPIGLERSSISITRSSVSITVWSYRSGACGHYGPIGLERSSVSKTCGQLYGPRYGHYSSMILSVWSVWSNRSGAYGPVGLERSSVIIARSVVSIAIIVCGPNAVGCQYSNRSSVSIARSVVTIARWFYQSGASYRSRALSIWSVWSVWSYRSIAVGFQYSSVNSSAVLLVCNIGLVVLQGWSHVSVTYNNVCSVGLYSKAGFYRDGDLSVFGGWFFVSRVVLSACDVWFYRSGTKGGCIGLIRLSVSDGMGGYIGLGRRYCGSIASFYWSVTGGFIYSRGGSIGGAIGLWGWPGGLSVWDSLGRWSSINIADWFYRSQTMVLVYQGGSFGCGWWSVSIARRFYLFGTSRVVLSVCDDGTLAASSDDMWSYRSGACGSIGLERSSYRSRASYRSGAYGPIGLERSSYRSRACGPIGLERSVVSIARSVVSMAYGPLGLERSVVSIARLVFSIARSSVRRSSISKARSSVSIAR